VVLIPLPDRIRAELHAARALTTASSDHPFSLIAAGSLDAALDTIEEHFMKSFTRLVAGAFAIAGSVLIATPALAADNTFELSSGKASAYGTYDRMMSIPERPVPPIAVNGTLAVNRSNRCAVVQIAYNGPADGIEWRTLNSLCRPGKTNFSTSSGFLWGGAHPEVRLCTGTTVKRAEQGRNCDVFTPPADL
jgi:hypothetical protein